MVLDMLRQLIIVLTCDPEHEADQLYVRGGVLNVTAVRIPQTANPDI